MTTTTAPTSVLCHHCGVGAVAGQWLCIDCRQIRGLVCSDCLVILPDGLCDGCATPTCGQFHLDERCTAWQCLATYAPEAESHWSHETTCSVCAACLFHCSDHCPRLACVSCDDPFEGLSCSNCYKCPDCCECYVCLDCDARSADEPCSRCAKCEGCCECAHCRVCGPVETTCETCELCDSGRYPCCECVWCAVCDEPISRGDACLDCDHCDGHCTCEPDDEVDDSRDPWGTPRRRGHGVEFREPPKAPQFHASDRSNRKVNPSKRFAALEIEVASAGLGDAVNDVAERWNAGIVRDGSLPTGGFEINTAPANGDLLLQQIDEWASALAEQSAAVTKDCGLHVHIDARDFSFYDMRRLILLYEKLEPALFQMVPYSRRGAQWCVPCGTEYADAVRQSAMPKSSKANLIGGVYHVFAGDKQTLKRTVARAKENKYSQERYHALNIHSWFYRGTVECRLHTGTVSKEKLTNWALLWVAIVDAAYRMSEREIVALTDSSENILRSVAPTPAVADWIAARIQKWGDS